MINHRPTSARGVIALLIGTLCVTLLVLSPSSVVAGERAVLAENNASKALQTIVAALQNTTTPAIPYDKLFRTSDYFVRIAPRKFVLTSDNRISNSAILGIKPFVFMTTPESLFGKSLLDIYLDIGYEAEDIIRSQRDQDMVAIVFRYPQVIGVSDVRDGSLPESWRQMVFVPTWDNVFVLFDRLATEATIAANEEGEFQPERLFFRSDPERSFVLGFPGEAKKRMRTLGYNDIRTLGGADWIYRKLLEDKLSIFEHFRGNGRTLNEITDPDGIQKDACLLEFVGPNMKVKDLAEVAIVHLGKMVITDTYAASAQH